MNTYRRSGWLGLSAFLIGAIVPASPLYPQISVNVDVAGYLCRDPIDVQEFQNLASTSGDLSRAKALKRFNRDADEPRCQWYEDRALVYKGPLRQDGNGEQGRTRYLFVGGKGGVFEVLVYVTRDGADTLYSWRKTEGEAG